MENVGGGQNGINGNFSWDFREVWVNPNTHNNTTTTPTTTTTTTTTTNNNNHSPFFFSHQFNHAQSMYIGGQGQGGGLHVHPDPHLTCLKLGKRHYFEDSNGGTGFDIPGLGVRHMDHQDFRKRGRSYEYGGPSSSSTITTTVVGLGTTGAVPRCQVEGCHVALLNAKDYHRRHKVCEMHSKSPKVIVLGTEQRFCQQCSRFHAVSEFDDSKRSCRRRLAGHNERRRKNTNDSISRNLSQDHRSMNGRLPSMSSSTGRALSLLSSKTTSWVSPSDLSSRSSAALRELIAENRAAVLSRQLFLDQGWHHHHAMDDLMSGVTTQPVHVNHHHHPMFSEPSEWERFHEAGAHVTLDLMQDSGSPFGFLSGRNTSKEEEEEEECREIWKSLEGTHVV